MTTNPSPSSTPMSESPSSWPAAMIYNAWRMRFVRVFVVIVVFGTLVMIGRCTAEGDAPVVGQPNSVEKAGTATIWTCSMHPQIRANKPGQCPICYMDLIPVVSDDADAESARLTLSDRAKVLARVETTEARLRTLTNDIRMVGKVAPDETRITYISSYIPGRIDRLFVDYTGIMVRKGDHLAELYSPELLVAQREYLLALQGLKQSDAAGRADTMARTSAQSIVEASRRKLELWGIPEDEIDRLARDGSASDHMRIDAPSAGWVLERKGYKGMYVETGTRLFTVVDLTRVWVLLDAYESDVQYLRYGQPIEFESESFAGETLHGKIAYIDPVLNEATRTVKVRVNVPNPDLRLRPGMFVSAAVHATLGKGGKVLTNELAGKYICPMHPEVISDEPGTCNECGMALVTTESLGYASTNTPAEKVLAIPITSVLLTGRRAVVYVEKAGADGESGTVYDGRVVELGPRAGEWYAVLSGLEEGDRVVTRGALHIDSAMQIQARPSMMQPAGVNMPADDTAAKSTADPADDASRSAPVSHASPGADYHAHARPMIDAYLKLTAALAADDVAASQGAVAQLHKSAGHAAQMAPIVGLDAEQAAEFKRITTEIAAQAELGNKPVIDVIRNRLPKINAPFETYLKTFGHDRSTPVFRAFCPMAFDNAGGYWFQTGDTIDNVYFGRKMRRCGVIKGAIGPDGKAAY